MVLPIAGAWRETAGLAAAALIETDANDRKVAKRHGRCQSSIEA
jgi:hypothetical protein